MIYPSPGPSWFATKFALGSCGALPAPMQPVSAVAAMPETSAARAMRSEGNEVIIINLSSRRGEPRSELKRRQPYRQRPSLLEKGEHNEIGRATRLNSSH